MASIAQQSLDCIFHTIKKLDSDQGFLIDRQYSTSLLTGDRPGWHEAAGTILVISTAWVELKPPSGWRRGEPAP
jgi:hypothetical protein